MSLVHFLLFYTWARPESALNQHNSPMILICVLQISTLNRANCFTRQTEKHDLPLPETRFTFIKTLLINRLAPDLYQHEEVENQEHCLFHEQWTFLQFILLICSLFLVIELNWEAKLSLGCQNLPNCSSCFEYCATQALLR